MADPFTLFGISDGVGPSLSGANTMRAADMANAKGLHSLFDADQAAQMNALQMQRDQLAFDEASALSPGRIQVGIRESQEKLSAMDLEDLMQFGQVAGKLGASLDLVPPEKRQSILAQIAQAAPEIADDPVFHQLMQSDPNQLPLLLRQLGTDIQLESAEYIQKDRLQQRKAAGDAEVERMRQEGALERENLGNAAAMDRARLQAGTQAALERERIAAGKYASKRAQNDPATIISKLGYEKAAVYYDALAKKATDPAEKDELKASAEMMRQLNLESKAAGVKPGMMLDPAGNIVPNQPYGVTAAPPLMTAPPAAAAPSAGNVSPDSITKAFGNYEPDKYMYRINPQTGKLQRKAR